MSKIHTNKIGSSTEKLYDSISFGQKIFVEEMPQQSIPADYEKIEDKPGKKSHQQESNSKKEISFNRILELTIRVLALSALGFIAYIMFGGILENSEMVLRPMGKELGIVLGVFTAVSIITILFLFSKTKVKIFVENGQLHVKSYRGINHIIPIEAIAECKVNIFRNVNSIKTFVTSKQYKIDLEAGLLIIFKDGQNLLIASSNSYNGNKNLAFIA